MRACSAGKSEAQRPSSRRSASITARSSTLSPERLHASSTRDAISGEAITLGRADYQRQYEPILYGWKQGADHFWCGARDQGDVWFIDKPRVNDLHPTMKPVELVERAITNSSKSRDIVLDLFGGSGTTLIAAERTGRSARLMELDPNPQAHES